LDFLGFDAGFDLVFAGRFGLVGLAMMFAQWVKVDQLY